MLFFFLILIVINLIHLIFFNQGERNRGGRLRDGDYGPDPHPHQGQAEEHAHQAGDQAGVQGGQGGARGGGLEDPSRSVKEA